MLNYKGQYNEATVMLNDYGQIDETTVQQIYSFLNHPAFGDGKPVVIMPDCHAGSGSCIGFTMPLGEWVIPGVVGVDIGCGVLAVNLEVPEMDFAKLDEVIRASVPSGFSIHKEGKSQARKRYGGELMEQFLTLARIVEQPFGRAEASMGTLGGGNHFIEVDKAPNGDLWLLIHSGSRNLGLQVAEYHQRVAAEYIKLTHEQPLIKGLEALPVGREIGAAYLHDMYTAQEYARCNRELIAYAILQGYFRLRSDMLLSSYECFHCTHNYISKHDQVIRKGAISAHAGERVLIPLNMRDGIIMGVGKGNAAWNQSAPHGAGRVLSRSQARKRLSVEDFRNDMQDVWTSCVSPDTIDEAPRAYKPIETIMDVIGETVDVSFVMKPVYNFKAS